MPAPALHRKFLENATLVLQKDARVLGVAVAGSWINGEMDEHSDLDLIVCTADDEHAAIMSEREQIARSLGPYLVGFTGEHVGEPRLFICLFGPPVLHVDLKFVSHTDFHVRVENPEIVWEREGALTTTLQKSEASWPPLDRQWIEDRFWVWIHYGALKVARGEYLEAMDFLAFVRASALGPMALTSEGHLPRGVRKVEMNVASRVDALLGTVATHDAASGLRALDNAIELYADLREHATEGVDRRVDAEWAVRTFVQNLLAKHATS